MYMFRVTSNYWIIEISNLILRISNPYPSFKHDVNILQNPTIFNNINAFDISKKNI